MTSRDRYDLVAIPVFFKIAAWLNCHSLTFVAYPTIIGRSQQSLNLRP